MRRILAVLTAVAGLTASYPVFACDVGARPVDSETDPVRDLRAEASRLDARAASRESSAASLDRQGEAMTARARELRRVVNARVELDRELILAQIQRLDANAAVSHAAAAQRRAEATELRVAARELRTRAVRLAGGTGRPGGGWRGTVNAQTI